MTITTIILNAVKEAPDNKILSNREKSDTVLDIFTLASKISSKLLRDGIKKNDRIALLSNNTHSFVAFYMACLGIGAIACPVNLRQKPQDIAAILSDLGPAMVFADTKLIPNTDYSDMDTYISTCVDETPFQGFGNAIEDDGIAVIQYTSGTSGVPKGVMLSHKALEFSAKSVISGLKLSRDEKILILCPFSFALTIALPVAFLLRCDNYIFYEALPDPTEIIRVIKERNISFILGALPFALMLLGRTDLHKRLPALKRFHCFGSAVPEKAAKAFEAVFRAELSFAYALTESGYVGSLNSSLNGSRGYSSIGKPFPGVNIELQEEEIVISSPAVMSGYYGDPQKTAKTLIGGKIHTGDIGRSGDSGEIVFLGRRDEMYKTNGLKVYPAEIENALLLNEYVALSAVVGVPDEQRQHAGKAYVILRDKTVSKEDLILHLKKYVSDYKIPKYFEFLDQLPLNSSGKVDKKCLKV